MKRTKLTLTRRMARLERRLQLANKEARRRTALTDAHVAALQSVHEHCRRLATHVERLLAENREFRADPRLSLSNGTLPQEQQR